MTERPTDPTPGAMAAAMRALPMSADRRLTLIVARAIDAAVEEERGCWMECALYDATMEGPKFKGWNRSALDRLRREYEP